MKSKVRDLTKVETVYRVETLYRRKMRTVRVRRRHAFAGQKKAIGRPTVITPGDVHEVFRAIYAGLDEEQEHFVMLVLNGAGQVEGFKRMGSGAQDSGYTDCKLVFRSALLLGARCIAVAHNRPSGSLVPSAGDIELMSILITAGKVLDMPLLDHCILGHHADYVSLYEQCPALFEASGAV